MLNKVPRHVSVKLIRILIIIFTLLIPNVAILIGGIAGSLITYIIWPTLIILSTPYIYRSGIGAMDAYKGFSIGLILITIFIALGFVWGFNLRVNLIRLSPTSFIISFAIFLIQVIGIEVGRSATVGLVKGFWIRMILGTLSGLFLGSTIYVTMDYFLSATKTPISILPSLLYSMILTSLHILGGFKVAITFRLLVDGYMRFSPIVANTGELGMVWSGFQSMIYYGVLITILYSIRKLRGVSKDLFEFSKLSKLKRYIPEAISLILVIMVLLTLHFKIIPLVIISGSMRPTYDVGDIVLVALHSPCDIEVGDVIAFIFGGKEVVVHRIYQITKEGFRTKGDAYINPDPFIVRRESVVGKVVGYIPKLGWVTIVFREGLKSYEGVIGVTLIALLIIIGISMRFMRRRKFKFKRSGTYW